MHLLVREVVSISDRCGVRGIVQSYKFLPWKITIEDHPPVTAVEYYMSQGSDFAQNQYPMVKCSLRLHATIHPCGLHTMALVRVCAGSSLGRS